jgi:hypothetical protein
LDKIYFHYRCEETIGYIRYERINLPPLLYQKIKDKSFFVYYGDRQMETASDLFDEMKSLRSSYDKQSIQEIMTSDSTTQIIGAIYHFARLFSKNIPTEIALNQSKKQWCGVTSGIDDLDLFILHSFLQSSESQNLKQTANKERNVNDNSKSSQNYETMTTEVEK